MKSPKLKPDYRKKNIVYEGIEVELLSGDKVRMSRAEKALKSLTSRTMNDDDFAFFLQIGEDEREFHSRTPIL